MKKNFSKPSILSRKLKRKEKSNLLSVLTTKPFNPWQSTYKKAFSKSVKRIKSLKPLKNAVKENPQKNKFKIKVRAKKTYCKTEMSPRSTKKIQNEDMNKEETEIIDDSLRLPTNKSPPKKKSNFHSKKLETIVKNNVDYFAHIAGKCLCGDCICGHCKCSNPKQLKLGVKQKKLESTFERDFPAYKEDCRRKIVRHATEQLPLREKAKGKSTYQKDFIPLDHAQSNKEFGMDIIDLKNKGNQVKDLKAPFPSGSTNQQTFLNWKDSVKVSRFGNEKQFDRIKIPFNGKASSKAYGNFCSDEIMKDVNKENFGKPEFDNPLGPMIKIQKNSTSKLTFKKFKQPGKSQKILNLKDKELIVNYQGHFKTSNNAYEGKPLKNCPSKEVIIKARKKILEESLRKYSELLQLNAQ